MISRGLRWNSAGPRGFNRLSGSLACLARALSCRPRVIGIRSDMIASDTRLFGDRDSATAANDVRFAEIVRTRSVQKSLGV
jgi:hypothetical protein